MPDLDVNTMADQMLGQPQQAAAQAPDPNQWADAVLSTQAKQQTFGQDLSEFNDRQLRGATHPSRVERWRGANRDLLGGDAEATTYAKAQGETYQQQLGQEYPELASQHGAMRQDFEQTVASQARAQKLQRMTKEIEGEGEGAIPYIAQRVPGFRHGWNAATYRQVINAADNLKAGKATDADYAAVAGYMATQAEEDTKGFGRKLVDFGTSLPAEATEWLAGGKVLGGLGIGTKAAAEGATRSLLARLASATVQGAARTATADVASGRLAASYLQRQIPQVGTDEQGGLAVGQTPSALKSAGLTAGSQALSNTIFSAGNPFASTQAGQSHLRAIGESLLTLQADQEAQRLVGGQGGILNVFSSDPKQRQKALEQFGVEVLGIGAFHGATHIQPGSVAERLMMAKRERVLDAFRAGEGDRQATIAQGGTVADASKQQQQHAMLGRLQDLFDNADAAREDADVMKQAEGLLKSQGVKVDPEKLAAVADKLNGDSRETAPPQGPNGQGPSPQGAGGPETSTPEGGGTRPGVPEGTEAGQDPQAGVTDPADLGRGPDQPPGGTTGPDHPAGLTEAGQGAGVQTGGKPAASAESAGGGAGVLKKTYPPPERRSDLGRRKAVSEMSSEEMKRELLTSQKTGLGNLRAYEESPRKAFQAFADADGLKQLNDRFGHDAGDKLLKAIGEAFQDEGVPGYHLSGDEFAHEHDSPEALHADMKRVQDRLSQYEFVFEDPSGKQYRKKGVGLSYGVATSLKQAEVEAGHAKVERERTGQRELRSDWEARVKADKSAIPRGVSEVSPAGEQIGQGSPAAAPAADEAKVSRMTATDLHDKLQRGEPIGGLTKRQQADLKAHVVDGLSLEEAGKRRGVTYEAVRQSVDKALQKLHGMIEEPPEGTVGERAASRLAPGDLPNEWVEHPTKENVSDALTEYVAEAARANRELPPEHIDRILDLQERLDHAGPSSVTARKAIAEAAAFLREVKESGTAARPAPAAKSAEPAPAGEAAGGLDGRDPIPSNVIQQLKDWVSKGERVLVEDALEHLGKNGFTPEQLREAKAQIGKYPAGIEGKAKKSRGRGNFRQAEGGLRKYEVSKHIQGLIHEAWKTEASEAGDESSFHEGVQAGAADGETEAGEGQHGAGDTSFDFGANVPGTEHHAGLDTGSSLPKPGDERHGWRVTEVLPAIAAHADINSITGERRAIEGRGPIILAEHPELGGGDFEPQDWRSITAHTGRDAGGESGAVDLDVMQQALREKVAEVKGLAHSANMGLKELSGEMAPRTTELDRHSGEALARWMTAGTYAEKLSKHLIEKVFGTKSDPEFRRLVGATLDEMRFRHAKGEYTAKGDQAAAAQIPSFVGQQGSPFQTEADYQAALVNPKVKEAIQRYKDEVVPHMEAHFKLAEGIDPLDPIDQFTQIPGLPVNAKAVQEGESPDKPILMGGGRGNLKNPKNPRLGFARQFKGTADSYDVDMGNKIENSIKRGYGSAAKHDAYRTMIEGGVAEKGVPNQKLEINGKPAVEYPNVYASKGPQSSLYVDADANPEFRKATKVDAVPGWQKVSGTLLSAPTKAALASFGEASAHIKNMATSLLESGVRPWETVSNAYKIATGNPEVKERLLELARIGADKPAGTEVGALGSLFGKKAGEMTAKVDPTAYVGKFLDTMRHVMMLNLDSAYDRLVASGKSPDTETGRRNFINKSLGQYEKTGQHKMVQFLRDTGIGPFATAATTFTAQGLRTVAGFKSAAETTGLKADLQLRAAKLAKVAAVVGAGVVANTLLWGRWDGDDSTPLGSVKIGEKNGKTLYIGLGDFTGLTRGLKMTGGMALAEGIRGGKPKGMIANDAAGDIMRGIAHPADGPGVEFLHTAVTGRDHFGKPLAPKAGEDDYQPLLNVKAALQHANPIIGARVAKPGEEKPGFLETINKGLGPLGVKSRPTMSKAESLARALGHEHMPEDPDAASIEKSRMKRDLRDSLAPGDVEPLKAAIRRGDLSPSEGRQILKDSHLSPIQRAVQHLPFKDAVRVYELAREDEQKQLRPLLGTKYIAARKGKSAKEQQAAQELWERTFPAKGL